MAPNLNSEDYYEILGVPRGSDDAALKKAYKKLAVKWHPDKNPGDEQATTNFQKISEAYATLSDEKKRKIYDAYGKDAANQSDQMPDNMPMGGHGGFHGGGMPGGFHFGGPGGGRGGGMSPQEAEFLFSQFFGGSDPFGTFGGGGTRGGGPGIRINMGGGGRPGSRRGGDPFGGSFGMPGGMSGMGGMPGGMGGMSGFGGPSSLRQQPKRYDAIHPGTIVSLKGLVNRADRNGDRGEVVQYDPSSGRYIVQIEDSDETMKVKPFNLLQHVHVTLNGIQSQPGLNGQKGTILAWDPRKERYNVYIMSTSKVMSLKPSNVVLDDETVGQIVGLQAKPELNGKWGTIKKFNSQSGRYDVQISADQILRLKLENILV